MCVGAAAVGVGDIAPGKEAVGPGAAGGSWPWPLAALRSYLTSQVSTSLSVNQGL